MALQKPWKLDQSSGFTFPLAYHRIRAYLVDRERRQVQVQLVLYESAEARQAWKGPILSDSHTVNLQCKDLSAEESVDSVPHEEFTALMIALQRSGDPLRALYGWLATSKSRSVGPVYADAKAV